MRHARAFKHVHIDQNIERLRSGLLSGSDDVIGGLIRCCRPRLFFSFFFLANLYSAFIQRVYISMDIIDESGVCTCLCGGCMQQRSEVKLMSMITLSWREFECICMIWMHGG